MTDQGQVGQATNAGFGSGTIQNLRLGGLADLITSDLHGRMFEQCMNGNLFSCANQTPVTTSTTLNTTFTGLGLENPANSGVNLVLWRFYVAQVAVGAASTIALAGGLGTCTGTIALKNCLVGSAITSKAVASASATLSPAPVLLRPVGSVGSLATTGYGLIPSLQDNIDGSIIIPPGAYIVTDTTVATTSSLQFCFVWEEVPLNCI